MSQTLVISLKPYLQEYCRHRWGEELTSRKNPVGLFIQKCISYTPQNIVLKPVPTGPDRFEIALLQSHGYEVRRGNTWMTPENQTDLARMIYQMFRHDFYNYLDDRCRMLPNTSDATIKALILQFTTDYGLSPQSIEYDTLKKAWWRHRRRKEELAAAKKKMKFSDDNMSLFCPLIFYKPAYEPLYATQY